MAGKSQAKVPLVSSMSRVNLVDPTSNSPLYISSTVAWGAEQSKYDVYFIHTVVLSTSTSLFIQLFKSYIYLLQKYLS